MNASSDRQCRHLGCTVFLTELNRARGRWLCITHERASDRARYHLKMGEGSSGGSKPRLGPDGLPLAKALHVVDAARQGVHAAVSAFLSTPTDLDLRADIETALKVFEIRWYLDALAKREPTEFVTIGLDKGTTHRVDLTTTSHKRKASEPSTPTNPGHLWADCSTSGV